MKSQIYYFSKPFQSVGQRTTEAYPEDYITLPELLYVDYKWSEGDKAAWFERPHWQRLDLLSARGNSLHLGLPTLPISLFYENTDKATIKFYDSWPAVTLYHNLQGATYLGYSADLSAHGIFTAQTDVNRGFWICRKNNVVGQKMSSAQEAVQRLRAMLNERREDSFVLYKTVVERSIDAHRQWVANNGYTILADRTLGQNVHNMVLRIQSQNRAPVGGPDGGPAGGGAGGGAAGLVGGAGGPAGGPATGAAQEANINPAGFDELRTRLQGLWDAARGWSETARNTANEFIVAANRGTVAVARFVTADIDWNSITVRERNSIIDIWELIEQIRVADEADESDDEDGDVSGAQNGRDSGMDHGA
jgi:hypothetical protein